MWYLTRAYWEKRYRRSAAEVVNLDHRASPKNKIALHNILNKKGSNSLCRQFERDTKTRSESLCFFASLKLDKHNIVEICLVEFLFE